MSDRVDILKALREQLGMKAFSELHARSVKDRPLPERLLRRLTEPDPLLDTEREVMVLMASGLTNQEIADELGISRYTVNHRLKRIYLKLGVHNRVEAVNAFIEWEA